MTRKTTIGTQLGQGVTNALANRTDDRMTRADREDIKRIIEELAGDITQPMLLWCPDCGGRHVDKGHFATKPHHTHACQHCGMVWRPAVFPTVGVQFLPGFKDEE